MKKTAKNDSERTAWNDLRAERMSESGALETYSATRLAFQIGCTVRELRLEMNWSQPQLAQAAGMTKSAVARLEAGGTAPTVTALHRLACALDTDLTVSFVPRAVYAP